jgi:hypothetical protein
MRRAAWIRRTVFKRPYVSTSGGHLQQGSRFPETDYYFVLFMNFMGAELRAGGNPALSRGRGTAATGKKKAVNAFTA